MTINQFCGGQCVRNVCFPGHFEALKTEKKANRTYKTPGLHLQIRTGFRPDSPFRIDGFPNWFARIHESQANRFLILPTITDS